MGKQALDNQFYLDLHRPLDIVVVVVLVDVQYGLFAEQIMSIGHMLALKIEDLLRTVYTPRGET